MKSKIFLFTFILLGFLIPFVTLATGSQSNQSLLTETDNIEEGDRGKNWTLKEIFSDQSISFQNYYGKIVVLDFFATWCTPCIESFTVLRDLNDYYSSSQVSIISIDTEYTEKTEAEIEQFAVDNNVNWEVVIDSISLADDYSVLSIPTFFIFDQKQKLVEIYTGLTSFATMKKTIDATITKANQRPVSEIWSNYWYLFIFIPTIVIIGVVIFIQRRKFIQVRKAEEEKKREELELRERKRRFRR